MEGVYSVLKTKTTTRFYKLLFAACLAFTLVSCNMLEKVQESTTAIDANRKAVEASTVTIESNRAAVQSSNAVIAANKEVVHESTTAIRVNEQQ